MIQLLHMSALAIWLLTSAAFAAESTSTRQQQVDNLAPLTACNTPVDEWKRFYDLTWMEINDTYYDVSALADFAQLRHKYDNQLCTLENFDKAVKLMTASLNNRWTNYLSRADIIEHNRQLAQGFYPIGMELNKQDGAYRVEYLYWGSAAQRSALQEGDVIKSIDGVEIAQLSVSAVQVMLTRLEGNKMIVEAIHNGLKETVELVFSAIPQATFVSKLMPASDKGYIGYIRLPNLENDRVLEQFIKELSTLIDQAGGNLSRLILDLRWNPGGGLPTAVAASSLFLSDGAPVCTNYVRSSDTDALSGMKGKPYTSMPADAVTVNKNIVDPLLVNRLRKMRVVLLINGSTVSAAEVVTGAFKDNKRATIIGTRSFGKAVGFLTRGLPFGGLLSLTKAKYVTPSGYDVSDKGIEPTIVVEHDPSSSADEPIDVAVTVLSQPENSLNAAVEP